jgi:hypothetical protein
MERRGSFALLGDDGVSVVRIDNYKINLALAQHS